jgi:hypothetical protein
MQVLIKFKKKYFLNKYALKFFLIDIDWTIHTNNKINFYFLTNKIIREITIWTRLHAFVRQLVII